MTVLTPGAAVTVSGPLVDGNPGMRMALNIEAHMEKLASEGAANVRERLRGSSGAPIRAIGDHVADHVIGRTFARPSRGGRRWHTSGVIQVYNEGYSAAQGRSLMAAASIVEGRTNAIRDETRRIASDLRQIDLTKGLE